MISLIEQRSYEDVHHKKTTGLRVGSLPSSAAFIPGGQSEENQEETENQDILNEFSDVKLDLNTQKHNKLGQTHSRTANKKSEESGYVFKTRPTMAKTLEHVDIKVSKGLGKHDLKTDLAKEMHPSQTELALQQNNYIETENIDLDSITNFHPTVSTMTIMATSLTNTYLGDNGPYTQIQKLQIESGDAHLRKSMMVNALESQEDFVDGAPKVLTDDQKLLAEDNSVNENVNPKVYGMQPTERYRASFRTTDTYLTLQNAAPAGNEVISVSDEFLHGESQHYQRDGNSIPEGVVTYENDTDDPYFSPLSQPKIPLDTVDPSSDLEISHQPDPSTSLPTLRRYLIDPNSSDYAEDLMDYVTLEAKARTETEKILLAERVADEVATTGIIPFPNGKTKSPEQTHETPTSAMQVLGKISNQLVPSPNIIKEVLYTEQNHSSLLLLDGKQAPEERSSTLPGKSPSITLRNAVIGSAPPGLVMSTTWRAPMPKPQESMPGNHPPQSAETSTGRVFPNGTQKNSRRGEIRVTTQRAYRRPPLIDAPASFPYKKPTLETPVCNRNSGMCEYVGTNKTLLKWDDLLHTLSFAWEMHVYGTGVLFLLLSIIALVNLIGSPILHVTCLPYVLVANALLFVIGILRGVFFLLDSYGTKGKIVSSVALILYNVTFPLMLTTFATLVLLVLKIARLQVLPPNFQSLALLGVIAVIHFIVLLSADLLTHLLNPSVNMVLQILSISWGIFLMIGNFVAYYRLTKSSKDIMNEAQMVSAAGDDVAVVQTQGRSIKCMFTSSRVLLVSSIFGLLCCGMQVYAILWLYGLLGNKNEFSWSWWFLQFWYRIFELALCFSMIFVASHSFCIQCSSSDHTCWSKIISYFCPYKKNEAPEYPNNCYDWTNNIQDKMVNNNISKSIIRNHAENVPLKSLKENNETKSGTGIGNNSQTSSPLFKPRPDGVFGPKSQNVIIGRSQTSICFEKESMLSLTELEFRPPSPINLSRSIDEALFREHLVRDSIFLDSSLQYPSYLTRQDSCSSLKECSALNQTIDPLISADLKMRRCSNPDYLYSLAKGSSMTEVDSPSESILESKEIPQDVPSEAVVSVSSIDSVSKGSIKISWNPWRHGLSSVESLPLEDTPSTQLLKQGSQPSIMSKGSEHEKSLGRRFIERSQTTDSHSLASETIEL
ncbi:proline-rich transmembrane protein 3 [Gastrophryne carolinensis]